MGLANRSNRAGLSMIELLIVITIILVMAGLLFPALQVVRNNSLNTQCLNNRRQIDTALELYHDAKRQWPLSRPEDRPGGWTWELLPWLEEQPLQDRFDVKLPLNAPANLAAASHRPAVFACPMMEDGESTMRGVPMIHFVLSFDPIPRYYPTRTDFLGLWHLSENKVPWCESPERLRSQFDPSFEEQVHHTPFGLGL